MNIFKKKVDPKGAVTHSWISFVAGGRSWIREKSGEFFAAVLFGALCCLASILRGVEVPFPPPGLRRRGSPWISATADREGGGLVGVRVLG